MNKTTVTIVCILCSFIISAQEFSVELVNKTESLVPGKVHSLVFKIINPYHEPLSLSPEVFLPQGWSVAVSKFSRVEIEPQSSKILLVLIQIPAIVEKDDYKIEVTFTEAVSNQKYKKEFDISIKAIQKISLTSLSSNQYIKSGETIQKRFLLKNLGNTTEDILLETSVGALVEQDTLIRLLPGEDQIITVIQPTDVFLPKPTQNQIKLTAYPKGEYHKNVFAYSRTDILPSHPKDEDIWHRFPLKISAVYLSREQRGVYQDAFQGEIYGKGSLDEKNIKQLEFRALGPDRFGLSIFSRYEEYYINYQSKNFYVHLGDKTYSSSFLTEFSRYGRGVEIKRNLGKFELGGFYNKPRFFNGINQQYHLYSQYNFAPKTHLRYGYLLKETNDLLKHNLHYLDAEVQPLKNLNLKGEYAWSQNSNTSGEAWRLEGYFYSRKFRLTGSMIDASTNFSGFFTNSRFFTTNMQYRINQKWSVNANYRKDARNMQQDTLYGRSPYGEQAQMGLRWNYTKQGAVSIFSGIREHEDMMEPAQFHYRERFNRLEVNQKLWFFNLNLQTQFAQTKNYLLATEGNTSIYSTSISFNKYHTFFDLYGSYSNTSRYQADTQELFIYGLRVNSHLSQRLSAGLFYQNTHQIEDYFTDRNLFELQFNYKITSRQELRFVTRYALARRELHDKDFALTAQYNLYLDVPIKKIAQYGFLIGNISNLGVDKVEGIQIRLGQQTAITDTNGNFIIKNIKPDTYFLEIERRSLGIKDITNVKMPVQIPIVEGENHFDLSITRAADIKGAILVREQQNGNNNNLNGKSGTNSVIVEMTSENEVFRKICELNKPFDFTYLRPGKWKVKVYRNGLNRRYTILNESFEIDLQPGQEYEAIIQIQKQEREIKYLQEDIKVGYSNPQK